MYLAAAMFFLSVIAAVSSNAAEYVALEIFPEHVGVFTTDGQQQFVAYGVTASGARENITKQVGWETSDENLVTIDDNGLATIKSGIISGQVKVTASFPKTGKALTSINILLNKEGGK